jgi:hypothetical protein
MVQSRNKKPLLKLTDVPEEALTERTVLAIIKVVPDGSARVSLEHLHPKDRWPPVLGTSYLSTIYFLVLML